MTFNLIMCIIGFSICIIGLLVALSYTMNVPLSSEEDE